jgi:hypothetical protein
MMESNSTMSALDNNLPIFGGDSRYGSGNHYSLTTAAWVASDDVSGRHRTYEIRCINDTSAKELGSLGQIGISEAQPM